MKKKKSIANTIWIVILTIAALAWIYPIIMILMNSLKKESAISTGTAFKLPTADAFAGIANYVDAVASKGFLSNAAVNTAYSATTGESGSPTAIIRRIPAPASAMAAARSKRKTAAEAMGPASRWAHAPLAAGSTMAGMLFQHAGSGILTLK